MASPDSEIADRAAKNDASNSALRVGALAQSAKSTEKLIDRWEWVLIVCALVVAVGLVLEYWSMFVEFYCDRDWSRFKKVLGGLMVAGGVAGEFVFAVVIHRKGQKLRQINARITEEQDRTVAELNLLAEQERRARAKIEYLHSQRSVSPNQRKLIVTRLSKHRGQRFAMTFPPDDGESQVLAQIVAASLENAGWKLDATIQIVLPNTWQRNIFTGISVFTNPADAKSISAADDLPLAMDVSLRAAEPNVPPGVIGIVIPPKPPDPDTLQEIARKRLAGSPFGCEIIALVTRLSRFSGQAVRVEAPFADENAANLAGELFATFSMAQWQVIDTPFSVGLYPTDFENVRVGVSDVDDRENTVPQAAYALMQALKNIGVAGDADQLRIFQGMPRGQICVRVSISPFKTDLKKTSPPPQTPP